MRMPAQSPAAGRSDGRRAVKRAKNFDRYDTMLGEREMRSDTHFVAHMRCAAGSQPIEVFNLSPRGIGARTPLPLQIGEFVLLDLPEVGEGEAQVRWHLCGRFGALFVRRIEQVDAADSQRAD